MAPAHQRPEALILPSSHITIGVIKTPFTYASLCLQLHHSYWLAFDIR